METVGQPGSFSGSTVSVMVYYTNEYLRSFTNKEKAIAKIKVYIAVTNQAFINSGLGDVVRLKLHCTPQLAHLKDTEDDTTRERIAQFANYKGKDVKVLLQTADIAMLMTKNGVSHLHDGSFSESC